MMVMAAVAVPWWTMSFAEGEASGEHTKKMLAAEKALLQGEEELSHDVSGEPASHATEVHTEGDLADAGHGHAAASEGEVHSEAPSHSLHAADHGEGADSHGGDAHGGDSHGGHIPHLDAPFPRPIDTFNDEQIEGIWEKLVYRAEQEPFNVVVTVIFLLAVFHTFLAGFFSKLAHKFEHQHEEELEQQRKDGLLRTFAEGKMPVSFKATIFHFLGEVEAIFGIWLIPLLIAITAWHSFDHATFYISSVHYQEPIFIVVIMTIASTRPVIQFAERVTSLLASLGGDKPAAWWFSILSLLPLLGSFITEPAAMTIAAMLLSRKVFDLEPSTRFKYMTIGLLFVNVSVGGTLTHFAAPPVLMVAAKWQLDSQIMLMHFGLKAIMGILIANGLFFMLLRKELAELAKKEAAHVGYDEKSEEPAPMWIILVHIAFLVWTVLTLHFPPYVIGGLLFFMAFTVATEHHQYQVSIKGPLLVGFFLAALVTHGGFQAWWIEPILSSLSEVPLFAGAVVLTAFNDNAAITYLSSLVPALDPLQATDLSYAHQMQYAVLSGAVTGGGLTVIANAPNPAGQSILSKHFKDGINPLFLFLGAAVPTVILSFSFMLIRTYH